MRGDSLNSATLNSRLSALVEPAVAAGVSRQLKIAVATANGCIYQRNFGKNSKFFDVASLTKALVTVPLAIKLCAEKRLDLNGPVRNYLPWLRDTDAGGVKVIDLLRHHSGLSWWRPFYRELEKKGPEARPYFLKHKFRFEKIKPRRQCVYSDLDFIILGWIIESLLEMPLDEAANRYIFRPLQLSSSFFVRTLGKRPTGPPKSAFAPTLKGAPRGLIQGQVFDDNCYAAGGVSGHAGLFSTIEDVTRLTQEFLRAYNHKGHALWDPTVFRQFATRAVSKRVGDWALGFNLPTLPTSNAGGLVSPTAFGHWAFTGPSFWVDPVRGVAVVILANRTFPNDQDRERYKKFLNLRREIHDAIWEDTT